MAGPVQTRAARTWDSLGAQSWRGRLRPGVGHCLPQPGVYALLTVWQLARKFRQRL